MPFDQRPVDDVTAALAEQFVDVRVDQVLAGAEEDQVLEIADPGHQVKAEQRGQGEHREALALRVGVHGSGLDVGGVGQQALDQVHRLPHPDRDEPGEQRHVGVGDVVVRDAAHAPVPDAGLGQQVIDVGFHLGAVGGYRGAVPPRLDHVQLGEGVDHGRDRGVELVQVDVPVAHHRQLPRRYPGDVPGRLVRADVGPAGEHRHAVPAQRIGDLGVRSGGRAEMVVPAQQRERDPGHDRQQRSLRHPPADRLRELLRGLRGSRAPAPFEGRYPVLADHQVGVVLISGVQRGGRVQVRVPQLPGEPCRGGRQADLLAEPLQQRLAL